MKLYFPSLIYFLMSFLLSFSVSAAVVVEATVDRREMGLGDTVNLSVSVQSSESVEVQEPRVPQLAGFDLVNAWNSSGVSTKLVQGQGGMQFQTVRRQDFNYVLTPQKDGTLTIPGFEVVVDGKTYNTKPIQMKIARQGSGAAQPPAGMPGFDEMDEAEEMFNQLMQRRGGGALPKPSARNLPVNPNEAFFIQSEIDKTDVYEGEQIVVSWYIYTRGNILSLDRLKFPDLKGFWKEIIEEVPALNFTPEIVNGVAYRKALLASHALFPIKPGTSVIDEYKIKAQVQLPTSPFGAFGMGKAYTYQRSSERVKITVRPLPTEGKPADFSGAVGQFDVRAQVEGSQFPVNQPFSLKVRFEGQGNAKLIELPNLQLPAGIEVYDTKSDAKYFKNGRSYKEFEVLIIPRQEGNVQIPAMSFSMFDPVQRKYVSKKTESISVKVIPNPGGANNVGSSLPGSAPKPAAPEAKKDTLPDVLVSWDYSERDGFATGKMALWSLIYLAIALVLGWKARKEFGWGERGRDLKQEMQKRMKKVNGAIDQGDWRKAGTEMANVIYHVLGDLSEMGGASVEITKLLDQVPPSLRREAGTELARLIELTQILSFAPDSVIGKLKDPAELKKSAQEVEKVLLRSIALAEHKTENNG